MYQQKDNGIEDNGIKYKGLHNYQGMNCHGDVRCGTSRTIQCLCMSLISVSGTLFKYSCQWDELDLDGWHN